MSRNKGQQNGKKFNQKQKFKKGVGTVKEGQGFAEAKKKQVIRNYRKLLKKERRNPRPEGNNDGNPSTSNFKRLSVFQKAQEEYKKAKKEQERQIMEREARLKEKKEAIKKYKDKKAQRFKKLSMKTKYGQPVMKGRMELLLEQIRWTIGNESIE